MCRTPMRALGRTTLTSDFVWSGLPERRERSRDSGCVKDERARWSSPCALVYGFGGGVIG